MMTEPYPRDLVGYGGNPPLAGWPNDARLALSFVLNYEEGGEASVLHGDPASEVYLHEVPGIAPRVGERDLNVESVYEYGARAGFWRILRLFTERRLTLTVYAVGMALERNPASRSGNDRRRFRGGEPRLALDRLPRRPRARGAGRSAAAPFRRSSGPRDNGR